LIHLMGPDGEVEAVLAGAAVDMNGTPYAIADLLQSGPDARVTAVTMQPKRGLEYDRAYSLKVSADVSDFDVDAQNNPTPKKLRDGERNFAFTTMKPENLGQTDESFASPGLVVLGDRAYIGIKANAPNGYL